MELVDMLDLGSSAARCESSSLSLSTKNEIGDHEMQLNQLKVPSVVHGSGTLPISFYIIANKQIASLAQLVEQLICNQ